MEIAARADRIDADPSKQRARSWLEGKRERCSKMLGQEVWSFMSPGSHADGKHLPYTSIKEADANSVYYFPGRDRTDAVLAINGALHVLKRCGGPVSTPWGNIQRGVESSSPE